MDGAGWQRIAWGIAAVVAVLIMVRALGGSPPPVPPVAVGIPGASAARGERGGARPPRLLVHVAGAVRRPGLYRLPEGARVGAAVRRAGGPGHRADLATVNLAAPVQDGQQVIVGTRPAGGRRAAPVGGGQATGPISLGAATAEQLEELDGVGPTLAERIVEHRQQLGGFSSIDQLDDVDGIGPATLDALREQLSP